MVNHLRICKRSWSDHQQNERPLVTKEGKIYILWSYLAELMWRYMNREEYLFQKFLEAVKKI